MDEIIQQAIDWLLELTQLDGYAIIFITLPLAVIQGFLGLFPFATLIMLHISVLGIKGGLLSSWMTGTAAAIIVFLCCRHLFFGRLNKKWNERLMKYEKWQRYMSLYGVWTIIFLRTLPIMPNNLISFMSAMSPISIKAYLASSFLGNLSHIWLFGIISSSIVFPDTNIQLLIYSYILFCIVLTLLFVALHYKSFRRGHSKPIKSERYTHE
ncbi:TVP38/TMEM64 family protein [Paenibacillus senegalensis]|uniref:TVP38/TMEM64 family protein n=1 Tax=Paenibacillus senegalensis TaxID=1465766 RepID=UPI000288DAB7|nr:VTT domain-containing protein [Paenibacillus senegalensis]